MNRENMHQSIAVYYECVTDCPLRDRQFNFFEFVYVLSGEGYQTVNGNRVVFKAGDLFLLTPTDSHTFDLHVLSEFLIIRFDKGYIKEYQWKSIDHMECLLHCASHLAGTILKNEPDQKMVSSFMQSLLEIVQHKDLYNEDLERHLVNAIIVIAARNIAKIKPDGLNKNADKKVLDIIDYIQDNIYHPQKLKVSDIAGKFGLSQTYLGTYFRNQSGETMQSYISNYRIRLIEHRLQFSDKRVNEIVEEFGFADESHINKFFKRHKGMSLSAYRAVKG